jgi:prepilin-type N-terminal cleavage/methylation domain-containing protein/prepilin-type processing-associated H-X9-DG protein
MRVAMNQRSRLNPCGATPHKGRSGGAFTLIELLICIAIIAILAAILLPVLSHARQKAQGTQCLNNGHQMMTAMTIYGSENNDFFPPNPDDGNTDPGYNWVSGQAGIGGPQEFDPDVLQNPQLSLLITYLGGNITLFRCPADTRTGLYDGTNAALTGHIVPAARTFSMSQAVGTVDQCYDEEERGESAPQSHCGIPNMAVNGPWLNGGNPTNFRNDPYATYGKFSDVRAPSPSLLWVLLDENAAGLNDAAFSFQMINPAWLDSPGSYHNGACGFAFADGHSEIHRWIEAPEPESEANPTDWGWMQQRTSVYVGTTSQ